MVPVTVAVKRYTSTWPLVAILPVCVPEPSLYSAIVAGCAREWPLLLAVVVLALVTVVTGLAATDVKGTVLTLVTVATGLAATDVFKGTVVTLVTVVTGLAATDVKGTVVTLVTEVTGFTTAGAGVVTTVALLTTPATTANS
jgi:hypothetical protein